MNDVRFMISEEDLASGPGTRLDHSRTFVWQKFDSEKGQTKLLIETSEGDRAPPLTSDTSGIKALYVFTRPTSTTYILN